MHCIRRSSHLLISWSVWSCVFFNLFLTTEPQEINKKHLKAFLFFEISDLVDLFLSYPPVNLEFKLTVKKKKKDFMHIIHTLNTSTTLFLRCCIFFLKAWSKRRKIIPLQMYCIWMNEQVPGRSGATNMQMERLIAPKIKMTNISRIPAFLEQHRVYPVWAFEGQ